MGEAADGDRSYVWLDPAFDKGYHGCFTENGQETSFGIIVFMLLYFFKVEGSDIFVPLWHMLPIVWMRGHTKTCQLAYDERFEPYFERASLLPFVLQFKCVPPVVNHTTLTARWIVRGRRYTVSTFLLGRWQSPWRTSRWLLVFRSTASLSLDECATSSGVRGLSVSSAIAPPLLPPGERWKSVHPVSHSSEKRSGWPQGVDNETVEQYVRAYLWYLLS